MPTLILRFGILFHQQGPFDPHGPLFHRWLPDGEADSIQLPCDNPRMAITVWFRQRGFVDGGLIRYDTERSEVDPEIIPTQAILDAGLLGGRIEVQNVSDETVNALQNEATETDPYMTFGKEVVRTLVPAVRRFLQLLQTHFGQYWLKCPEDFDSRRVSLGAYCSGLQLSWSLDEGQSWKAFRPTRNILYLVGSVPEGFDDYLNRQDWEEIKRLTQDRFQPSAASFLLAETHRLLDEGQLRFALIQGVTAIEVTIAEKLKTHLNRATDDVLKKVQSFYGLPLPAQVVVFAAQVGVGLQDVDLALKAIERRNKIIHEISNPPEDAVAELKALMRITGDLLGGPRFRFPERAKRTMRKPLHEWNDQAKSV